MFTCVARWSSSGYRRCCHPFSFLSLFLKENMIIPVVSQVEEVRDAMENEMRTQLRRQAAAHTDHLRDVLRVQEQELKYEFEQVRTCETASAALQPPFPLYMNSLSFPFHVLWMSLPPRVWKSEERLLMAPSLGTLGRLYICSTAVFHGKMYLCVTCVFICVLVTWSLQIFREGWFRGFQECRWCLTWVPPDSYGLCGSAQIFISEETSQRG